MSKAATIRLCCTGILAVLLTGCMMASGPRFQPAAVPDGRSLIYVYREAKFAGSANPFVPRLWLDDRKLGSLRLGAYYALPVEPGEHMLKITAVGGKPLFEKSILVAADQTYYFEYNEVITDFKRYGDTEVAETEQYFIMVPERLALKDLRDTRLQTPKPAN